MWAMKRNWCGGDGGDGGDVMIDLKTNSFFSLPNISDLENLNIFQIRILFDLFGIIAVQVFKEKILELSLGLLKFLWFP